MSISRAGWSATTSRAISASAPIQLTDTALYRFCIGFAVLTFVADITSLVGLSDYYVPIKYAYTAIILIIICDFFWRWGVFDLSSPAPALALGFLVITAGTFFVNLTLYGTKASYVSAFIASLVFSAAAFVPPASIVIEPRRVLRDLLLLLCFGSVCFLIETAFKATSFGETYAFSAEVEPVKSIVVVLAIALSILLRYHALSVVLLLLAGAALIFRPTSTLVFALFICAPLTFALRRRLVGVAHTVAMAILILVIVTPLIFYVFFDEMSAIVTAAESYVKVDLLAGRSNTDFRLAVLRLALASLDNSLVYGLALNGETAVLLARDFAWWREVSQDGFAAIHSDFVVVLTQAGLVGYSLFAAFLYLMLASRFRALRFMHPSDEVRGILISLSVVGLIALILYGSFNPCIALYHIVHPIWLVLFISELTARSMLPAGAAPAVRKRRIPAAVRG
jgi:hypothetical protein